MFDRDQSGTIDLNEFQGLWNYLNQWRAVFDQFDRDRSGNIDVSELNSGTGHQLLLLKIRIKLFFIRNFVNNSHEIRLVE